MFENFTEYIWYLLWSPLKRVKKEANHWYKLFRAIGSMFDEVKEAFVKARRNSNITACDDIMLPVHAADRQLSRYEGESPKNFRNRINGYIEVCRLGGTNPGIIRAVKNLGYKDVEIISARELTGETERWAEFYVITAVNIDETLPIGTDVLKKTVRDTKEVGALDNYLFDYQAKQLTRQKPVLSFTYKKYIRNDAEGTEAFEFSCMLQNEKKDECYRYERHNVYYLDGSWQLDGSRRLDAYELEERL